MRQVKFEMKFTSKSSSNSTKILTSIKLINFFNFFTFFFLFFFLFTNGKNNYFVRDKYMRVWRIFAIIGSVFPPSESIFYPVLNYLHEIANDKTQEDDIRGYARYCFKRCVRSFEDDVRKEPPSGEEILYVEVNTILTYL